MKHTLALLFSLTLASPAFAQDPPPLSIRPFFLVAEQRFAASDSFDAVFDTSRGPFFGGGVQVLIADQFVIEVSASRFEKTGERAFRTGAGSIFRLGIPLTATITPLEITGGYRFLFKSMPSIRPYAAAGLARYSYKETSDFALDGENVDVHHSGYVVNGGVEIRLHRWIAAAVDAEYSHVTGILGTGGVSKQAGEQDLGGVAARVKFIVGR